MGGGGRYPYPKHVYSPSGGWWGLPHNWKSNTAVSMGMIFLGASVLFIVSTKKEERIVQPSRPILSTKWTAWIKDGTQ